MVGTESFLVMLFGGNKGFKSSENLDSVFYQRERHAKNIYKDFKNGNFQPRLGHKSTSLAFSVKKM